MAIPSETVALPVVKGLDLTTDDRLLTPPALLEAENTQFTGGGAHKRRGHLAHRVKSAGYFGAPTLTRVAGDEDVDFWHSAATYSGDLLGVFERDDETVAWDGVDLFSYIPSQAGATDPVFIRLNGAIPVLSSTPLSKVNEHQGYPEMADNGTTRVVAWINEHSKVKYAIYDSNSGTLVASGQLAVTTAQYLRAVTLGAWMHLVVKDSDDGMVKLYSIASATPTSVVYRSLGPATHFDLWKHSDSEVVLARGTIDGIYIDWFGTLGGGTSRTSQVYSPVFSAWGGPLSVCTHGSYIAVAWFDPAGTQMGGTSPTIQVTLLTDSGPALSTTFITVAACERLTVTSRDSVSSLGYPILDVFWDDGSHTYRERFFHRSGFGFMAGTLHTRYHVTLASRAFNIEDRTFLWAAFTSPGGVQSTWFLLDETLLPVGRCDFAVANTVGLTGRVAGINWTTQTAPHLALGYKLRVNATSANVTDGIYTEPCVRATYLDFRGSLNTAQAGRTTYIAGAQLWGYDGRELLEAGFHLGPETTLGQSSGGSLTALGTYSYRVDLCHRNAQNEEVRSLSILTSSLTLSGGNQTIAVTFNSVLTRRADSYFLIYRNAMSSGVPLVNWWLLNSRDPASASYLANDLTVSSFTYTDTGAVDDVTIQTRELHPASDTYVQPVSAPACEVVAAGRDRLWVAGGELLPGQVAPSRLFDPGECPTFNPYLAIQVDRSNEPVTGIGFIGEVGVIFRPNTTYLLDSDGPDNNADGAWNYPRLGLADVGATSQKSVARIPQGLVFQSSAGFRIIGPGGALTPLQPLDSLAKDLTLTGSLVIESDQEVRFYTATETLVYNYLYDTWARWSCGGIGVARQAGGLALVARSDGHLWVETDGVWTDGGSYYTHRIRTAWLHGGNVGEFQRVRRVGAVGKYADLGDKTHNLRLELFYDAREFWEDRHEWSYPDSTTNQDTWGAATWGAGVWGDTSATVSNLEDLTWDWQRAPAIQKCNSVSIALEDYNTDGPGFVLSAFTLELARKPGLDRGPMRTGTGSYRR